LYTRRALPRVSETAQRAVPFHLSKTDG